MFKLHDFVMRTLRGMKDRYPEFQVRQYALNWYSKGALTDGDLMEIEEWYAPVPEPEVPDDPEEVTENDV